MGGAETKRLASDEKAVDNEQGSNRDQQSANATIDRARLGKQCRARHTATPTHAYLHIINQHWQLTLFLSSRSRLRACLFCDCKHVSHYLGFLYDHHGYHDQRPRADRICQSKQCETAAIEPHASV